jgi:hypothetical protein
VTVTENDIAEIRTFIEPLLGQRPWDVSLGIGSFITMDFGRRLQLEGRRKLSRGEWFLWVYCCDWRLEKGYEILAASEDPRPVLREALRKITNLTLESVNVSPPAGDAVFVFEGGYTLRLFSVTSSHYESWKLFTPGRKVLVVGPGSHWVYEDSSGTRDSGTNNPGDQGVKDK